DIGDGSVEGLLPSCGAVRGLDQLRAHLHPALAVPTLLPANLSDHQILDPELLADLLGRLAGLLVLAGAVGRDDLEAGQSSQLASNRVGHAVGEVLVLLASQVLEWEHRDALGSRIGLRASVAVASQPAEQHTESEHE